MKVWPSIVVILAFSLLLYIGSMRPDDHTVTSTPEVLAPATSSASPATIVETVATTPPQPAAPRSGEITGVVYAQTQRGAPGVLVHLYRNDGDLLQSVPTDFEGKFTFKDVPADGTFTVNAEDPNFLYTMCNRVIVRMSGGSGQNAILTMSRGNASISGALLTTAKTALGNEPIELLSNTGLALRAMTEPNGTFRVGGLAAGTWRVFPVKAADQQVEVQLGEAANVSIEFPPVALKSSITFHFTDSVQHRYHFGGGEEATLTQVTDGADKTTQTRPIEVEESTSGHGGASVEFKDLPSGRYTLTAVDKNTGRALIPAELVVVLDEGKHRVQSLVLDVSKYGKGYQISTTAKLIMFVFFAVMFALPVAVFPPPFVGKRPKTAPRPTA